MTASIPNLFSEKPVLISFLQKPVTFSIKGKVVKRGRLLLFRKAHYFVQFSLETNKKDRESFDVPIPFDIEHYPEDELLYFDYRISSFLVDNLPKLPNKVSSIYFNNILEIQVEQPLV